MSKPTQSGSVLASLFPKLFKVVAATASTEEFNAAEAEAAAIEARLNPTEDPANPATISAVTPTTVTAPTVAQNETPVLSAVELQTQLTAAEKRATDAEATVTTQAAQITALSNERDRYKAWFDKVQASGKVLPGTDATTKAEGDASQATLSDASAQALAYFKGIQR